MTGMLLFWALAAVAFTGAVAVVFSRDVTRMTLGLGAFLLAVAGFFALFGFGFLALAQLFVYVGGVLVLMLFAVMLVHRSRPGVPGLETRHDLLAAIACTGLFAFLVMGFRSFPFTLGAGSDGVDALGELLLGKMLPQFELAGALLLVALVAVVVVSRSDGR